MKKKCSIENCEREVFKETGKCALHCEKHSYSEDENSGLLKAFYDALVEYIVYAFFLKKRDIIFGVTARTFSIYLEDSCSYDMRKSVHNFLYGMQITTKFDEIYFPAREDQCFYDYCKILQKIRRVHFSNCKFVPHKIEIPEVEVFFENCEFHQPWIITQSTLLNRNNTLYKNCTFKEKVILDFEEIKSNIPGNISEDKPDTFLFDTCSFEKGISLNKEKLTSPKVTSNKEKLNPQKVKYIKINELQIKGCKVQGKVDLNNLETDKLVIKDTVFRGKVELGAGNIGEAELNNTNFEGLFNSHSTVYGKFLCYRCIFSKFVGFEDGKFAFFEKKPELNDTAIFEYVTFESVTNFRSAEFYLGLDLEKTNFKEYPNFLNIEINSENTKRETFRIIKHSFDKIGNYIEANKFFAREMAEYKRELTKIVSKQKSFIKYIRKCLTKKYIRRTLGGKSLKQKLCGVINFIQRLFRKYLLQERFIFWFNEKASNFGQSYFRPIGWILLLSLVYSFFGGEDNANETKCSNSGFFNGIAKSILPLKRLLGENISFINLFFYIIFAILIWLTVVAVKRHTRR